MSNIPTAIVPEKESTPSIQISNGSHTARLIQIIDLGTQENTFDTTKPATRQFRLAFETPTEKAVFNKEKGEQPFLLSKTVTFSLSKDDTPADKVSALTKVFKAIRGELGDRNIFGLIGGLLSVQTEINAKGYATIVGFAPISKDLDVSAKKFAQVNPSLCLYLEPDTFDNQVYQSLPDFVKETIRKSPEFQALKQSSNSQISEPPSFSEEDLDDIVNTAAMPF